ncbi:glycosyltransferase family 39 protein [Xanthomarina gelatinilytica]|uniref:glycosyltransferase family 39 protein n=1 Tax=Xanthomarina gelatinilytica TaxID=1137281 RepID=UPI003AA7D381
MNKSLASNYKLLLALILILAAILRFYNLDFQSIWIDEIHTMVEANSKLTYSEFYDITVKREQMPHLYYLIARLFSYLFGDLVVVVRSVSAIAGILSVFGVYLLGKELNSRKVGIMAALLLSINHFHIYYSQEARPYGLLMLFTVFSFLYLVKFLNKQSLKYVVLFAVFSALMINTHFFGLFVLVSQAIILIIYLLFIIEKQSRKTFFKHCVIAGVILVILFLPSVPILLKISNIDSFWIKPPSKIFFKSMFYSFFGNSEFLIYIAELLLVIYFLNVLFTKQENKQLNDNKLINSFYILIIWLFITFMIPFIRSYASVPMLINRYFISALPAIIIIVAIGFAQIKSKIVYLTIACIFVISSLVDLFIVKDYYYKITKTQFREITKEVKLKNTMNDPIVYRKAWHMEHFFNDSTKLVNAELNNYLNKIKISNNNYESFWAIGAHSRPFKVSKANEKFLNKNYYLIDEFKYHDCWARYYLSKDNKKVINLNLNEFRPQLLKKESGLLFKSNVTISSNKIFLKKGLYRLALLTKSMPNNPINGENAHVDVSINGERLGGFFTNPKKMETTLFEFEIVNGKEVEIQITFDNDYFNNKKDRDLILYKVSIENIKQ